MSLSKASDIFKYIELNNNNYTSQDIAKRFDNTLFNLNEVLSVSDNKNGTPIYSVWIKFQLGENNPILFDSSSNIYERNLIANLNISKGQNGYANTFTLDIYYDAFKSGQETNHETAEVLDQWVAEAMSYDYNENTSDFLKGFLQYGYNQLDDIDRELYTPIYEFYLTDASSEVNYNTGITHYTFQGTSLISSDINFMANIERQEGRPLTVVKNVLTKYYGKEANLEYAYVIDIADELINQQQEDNIEPIEATYTNPLTYCKRILDEYPYTQAEIDSGNYTSDKIQNIKEGQRPQYTLYITESNGIYTIHVNHVSKATEGQVVSLNYMFDWSNTNNNIVSSWKPQADLKLYLIQMGKIIRAQRSIDSHNTVAVESIKKDGIVKGFITAVKESLDSIRDMSKMNTAKDELIKEYYDATLECIGIPADAPIGGIIRIQPVLMQSISRTAGIYFIKGAEDIISTNGIFKTTLTLFRINDISCWNMYLALNETHNGIYGPAQDPNINLYSADDNQKSEVVNKKQDYSYREQLSPKGGAAAVLNNLGGGPYIGPLN